MVRAIIVGSVKGIQAVLDANQASINEQNGLIEETLRDGQTDSGTRARIIANAYRAIAGLWVVRASLCDSLVAVEAKGNARQEKAVAKLAPSAPAPSATRRTKTKRTRRTKAQILADAANAPAPAPKAKRGRKPRVVTPALAEVLAENNMLAS